MNGRVLAAIFLFGVFGGCATAQGRVWPTPHNKPVPQYELTIRLMPDAHRLETSGTILLPAESVERATVKFSLRADMQTSRVEVFKPDACIGAVELGEAGEDKDLLVTRQWEVKPKRPFPAGEPILLKIEYAGGSDAKGGGYFNLGPEGSFGCGVNSAWYPVFDHQRGSGSFRYVVQKGAVVIASGALTDRRDNGDTSTFEFTADRPSIFGFAAGPYTVVRRREGRIPVTLHLFKDRPNAEEMLTACSRALEVLENEFGKYPFGEFALVESPNEASQAAGFLGIAYPGFFLARSEYLDRTSVDLAYIGHELSHEWFPYVVAHKGDTGILMLDEAIAHYGSLRTVEEVEGSAAAERHRRGGGDAIRLMAAGYDYPLGALPQDMSGAYSLSNSKGYVIYDLLSRTVGRDAFRAALRSVTSKYAFERVTWEEFLQEIQLVAGQDLGWFYAQWFNRTGAPTLSMTWSQDGDSLKYTITQGSPAYRLTLPVQIEFADGSAIIRQTQVQEEQTDCVISMPRRVHAVKLDPHFEVFHTTPKEKAEADAMRYFTRGNALWNSNQTDEARETFLDGLEHLPEVDAYGVEFTLRLHIGWIHQEASRYEEAKHQYEVALAQAVRPGKYLPRLYLNLALVAKELGDRERVVSAARSVLNTERALGQETGKSRQARELLGDGVP